VREQYCTACVGGPKSRNEGGKRTLFNRVVLNQLRRLAVLNVGAAGGGCR